MGGLGFGSPVSLLARWEDRQEEFLDAHQQTQLSKAVVFMLASLYKDTIEVTGYMYNGTSVVANPTNLNGAFEIRQKLVTPDIRNVRSELRVIL